MGLALAVLGVWMFVRGTGRRYGPVLAAVSVAWVAFAMKVVIPHFNEGRGTEFSSRYDVGSPWEAVQWVAGYDRLSYLGALLIPLLFLPLLAPLLAAGALPEVLINVLAEYFPQYSIQFQYVAVVVPFLVAASILGPRDACARRPPGVPGPGPRRAPGRWRRCGWGRSRCRGSTWGRCRGGARSRRWARTPRTEQYRVTDHSRAMARAVALIPDDVPVSAGNLFGSHLSERERVYTFPVIGDARWIIVDARRPYLADRLLPRAARRPARGARGAPGPAARVRRGRGVGVPAGRARDGAGRRARC